MTVLVLCAGVRVSASAGLMSWFWSSGRSSDPSRVLEAADGLGAVVVQQELCEDGSNI